MLQHSMNGFSEDTVRIQEEFHLLTSDEKRLGRDLVRALQRGALRTDGLIRVLNDVGMLRIPLDELEIYLVFGLSSQSIYTMSRSETVNDQPQARDYFGPLVRTYNFWEVLTLILEDRFELTSVGSKDHVEQFLDELSSVIESENSTSRKLREIVLLADSLTLSLNPKVGESEDFHKFLKVSNTDVLSIVLRFLIVYGDYCCGRMY